MELQTALGAYQIILAREEHVALLPEVERRAAQLYRGHGISDEIIERVSEVEALHEAMLAGLLWVALAEDGAPVGFAFVEPLESGLYLSELDVLPEHGRRGIGRALVKELCAFAYQHKKSVTLSTFSDIRWNAPFYKTLGFTPVSKDDYTPGMQLLAQMENTRGLPMERRVIMKRPRGMRA